ncbi:hypothetical protein ONE63_011519 [Megalurothrips usitatus]|uniref:F-box domain-containing protein n=1 Tax=Megalurothrips usitatus TaxID=439358 RepID=A0AAV7X2L4_9NEOP|nr:hypothetical protein ONE63_011519 [Megalurothrips usitatus]
MAPRKAKRGAKRASRQRGAGEKQAKDRSWDVQTEGATGLLPDGLLLEVLAYLDESELLLARAVCRRWRALAMSPAAWAERGLNVGLGPEGCRLASPGLVRAVLRQAPCLGRLYIGEGHWPLVQHEPMRLAVSDSVGLQLDEGTARRGADILRRQVELGARPKNIEVAICMPFCVWDLRRMLEAINDCQPETLTFVANFESDYGLRLPHKEPLKTGARPSLKKLTFLRDFQYHGQQGPLATWPHPTLRFLIASHAATLEDVRLYVDNASRFEVPRMPSSLLMGCVRLRMLCCSALADMPALLMHCPALEELALDAQDTDAGRTTRFFREASQLRRLAVRGHARWDVAPHTEDTLAFLEALASTGRSRLTSLSFSVPDAPPPAFWGRLVGVIGRLKHLEDVDTDPVPPPRRVRVQRGPPPAVFLRALAAPAMRTLQLDCVLPCGAACTALFLEELRRLMAANAELHVAGLAARCVCGPPSAAPLSMAACPWWRRRAPPSLCAVATLEFFNVYGHAQGDCKWHNTGPGPWIRVVQWD